MPSNDSLADGYATSSSRAFSSILPSMKRLRPVGMGAFRPRLPSPVPASRSTRQATDSGRADGIAGDLAVGLCRAAASLSLDL